MNTREQTCEDTQVPCCATCSAAQLRVQEPDWPADAAGRERRMQQQVPAVPATHPTPRPLTI
jgi:hypothetical protein